jgi:hypothetical protein
MNASQRAATAEICNAVLACTCASASLRLRARLLRYRVGYGGLFGIFD